MITGILADDLTGALDGGVQLTKRGLPVTVVLPGEAGIEIQVLDGVVVFDTESRNCSPETAVERVDSALRNLADAHASLVYKKIDSTMRGNVGAEIARAIKLPSIKNVIVTPALPRLGRTVSDGVLYVNGVALAETEFAKDPLAPATSSSIAEILRKQSPLEIRSVRVSELERAASECQVVIVDAVDETDLSRIADAATRMGDGVLCCGSAGLLEYLVLGTEAVAAPIAGQRGVSSRESGAVFAVSSSMSSTTRLQTETFAENHDVVRVAPDRDRLFAARYPSDFAFADGARVARALMAGRHAVLDVGGRHDKLPADPKAAAKESDILQEYLGAVVRHVFESAAAPAISGLVIAGGETALSVCTILEARGIRIAGEVEPFVPAGTVIGGIADGVSIVTKAGGFGSQAVFSVASRYLAGERGR